MKPRPDEIELRIWPLVDALNQTGVVRTFSSCEGHFGPDEQTLIDRNHAYVQFVPTDGVVVSAVETLMAFVLTRFRALHGLIPVTLNGYKRYTPSGEGPSGEGSVEETFVLELRPFNGFDPPAQKRRDIDRAVGQVARLLATGTLNSSGIEPLH